MRAAVGGGHDDAVARGRVDAHGPAVASVGEGDAGERSVRVRTLCCPVGTAVRGGKDAAVDAQPTAQPWLGSVKATPRRKSPVAPEFCVVQWTPPSEVTRMLPPSHTAQPWEGSGKVTAERSSVVPELCALQVAPPSVVARMVPLSPTAQP